MPQQQGRPSVGARGTPAARPTAQQLYPEYLRKRKRSNLSLGTETDTSVEAVLTPAEPGKPFYMLLLGSDSREG